MVDHRLDMFGWWYFVYSASLPCKWTILMMKSSMGATQVVRICSSKVPSYTSPCFAGMWAELQHLQPDGKRCRYMMRPACSNHLQHNMGGVLAVCLCLYLPLASAQACCGVRNPQQELDIHKPNKRFPDLLLSRPSLVVPKWQIFTGGAGLTFLADDLQKQMMATASLCLVTQSLRICKLPSMHEHCNDTPFLP